MKMETALWLAQGVGLICQIFVLGFVVTSPLFILPVFFFWMKGTRIWEDDKVAKEW